MIEDVNFVAMHRYQEIEKLMYNFVIQHKPNTIVELGHGSGAVTAAMALALQQVNPIGKVHSYDIISSTKYYPCFGYEKYATESAYDRILKRGLRDIITFTEGNVFSTYIESPIDFDLLYIDIDNTWDSLYKILIENKFINNKIKTGSKIIIEGGSPNHPRININTLNDFNKKFNQQVFKMKYLTGSGRTSIAEITL